MKYFKENIIKIETTNIINKFLHYYVNNKCHNNNF